MFDENALDFADEIAEVFDRDGAVLDEGDRAGGGGSGVEDAQADFADVPDAGLSLGVNGDAGVGADLTGLSFQMGQVSARELDDEQGGRVAFDKVHLGGISRDSARQADEQLRDEFDRGGAVFEQARDIVTGGGDAVVLQEGKYRVARFGDEVESDAADDSQGAFGTGQEGGEVDGGEVAGRGDW